MRDEACPFRTLPGTRIEASNALVIAVRDAFPVTDDHALIIARRHAADVLDPSQAERYACIELLDRIRRATFAADVRVTALNVDINIGAAAGLRQENRRAA